MSLEDKINSVIGNTYDYKDANCWDLVMHLNEHAPKIEEMHDSIFSTTKKFRDYEEEFKSDFKVVLFPDDGDIVLLGARDRYTHAGIFYSSGIVHASKNGVVWQPLHIMKLHYKRQKAYKWLH